MKRRNKPTRNPGSLEPARLATVSGGGGDGRDILIGGYGRDGLAYGGAGLDILIGNTGGDR